MDVDSQTERDEPGGVNEVVEHTKQVHAQGLGVISMKLCGGGRFTIFEDRDRAMRFAMNPGCVDAVTIGFSNTMQIDETIDRMARVMNA